MNLIENKALKIFSEKGILINKKLLELSSNFKKIPSFVSDYLISSLVDERNPSDGVRKINRIIEENYAESNHGELIKSKIRNNGKHGLLGYLKIRYDSSRDEYYADIPTIKDKHIRVSQDLITKFGESLLTIGAYGTSTINYDSTNIIKNSLHPFVVSNFIPLQVISINLSGWIEKRKLFETNEWIDLIINSLGYNPEKLTQNQKMLYLCRLIPFIEANVNIIELGPTETSKTHFYRNLSQYGAVLSGSSTSVASLFYNKLRRSGGLVTQKDFILFDEISHSRFDDDELINILKDFMNSGKFSRDKTEFSSGCGIIFAGNIDCDREKHQPQSYYKHLFATLPHKISGDRAFLDRLNALVPGWIMPKISSSLLSNSYGFTGDFFAEICHRLRDKDYSDIIKSNIDFGQTTFRNQQSVTKLACGLLKIIFPSKNQTDIELQEIIDLAISLRQGVINQLAIIAPGEFKNTRIEYSIKEKL